MKIKQIIIEEKINNNYNYILLKQKENIINDAVNKCTWNLI